MSLPLTPAGRFGYGIQDIGIDTEDVTEDTSETIRLPCCRNKHKGN